MSSPYADILHTPRPVSRTRAKMSLMDRAAQFAPFAALTGYEAAVAETARLTTWPVDLGPDEKAALDRKLRLLYLFQAEQPRIQVIWFVPDARKEGGSYESREGRLLRIRSREQYLQLESGPQIPFADILSLESPSFETWEQGALSL